MRDADLTPTGRELKDPAATLIECVDGAGLKHTVIAFDEPYRGHNALTTGVDLIMSFMAYPMVTGLVECTAADTKRARFAYPTGTVWTAKEIARGFEQVGQNVGQRAALELCYLSGMVLLEAGETGPMQGCFSHGNLNPWRIGMKADGQLQVFGYGLAQVEMDRFLREEDAHIALDSIRYAPPERLERQPEQPSSDIYSLAVLALELMTGAPLYDETDAEKMWNAVKLAEGVQRVGKLKIPRSIQDVLGSALVYDPDRRLHGQDFVDAIGNLLDDPTITGRTLAEVMDRMGNQGGQSKRKLVKAVGTAAFTPADLAALAASQEEGDSGASDAKKESRWSSMKGEATTGRRTSRRATAQPAERPSPRSRPEPDTTKKKKKKARASKPEPAAVEPVAAPSPATEEETTTPRRRRRSTAAAPPPPPDVASIAPKTDTEADAPASEAPMPRRRRRRTEAAPADASGPVDAMELADPVDDPPRRRRRRSAVQETPADPPPTRQRRRVKPLAPSEIPDKPVKSASTDTDDTPPTSPGDAVAATPPRRRRRRRSSEPDDS